MVIAYSVDVELNLLLHSFLHCLRRHDAKANRKQDHQALTNLTDLIQAKAELKQASYTYEDLLVIIHDSSSLHMQTIELKLLVSATTGQWSEES